MEVIIPPDTLLRARNHARTDEELAAFLKGEGLSKALSVIAFQMVAGIPHAAAKAAVHFSQAWSDRREADERVQAAALDALHGQL